ncbi:hypothetical protein PGQ11_009034 [Apiospora arundinis]|uniref:Uncharacterized protein n=1 Tax=Apiospora arundinis TaxID=335852 RepID=A0ABR2IGW4_9PEZI
MQFSKLLTVIVGLAATNAAADDCIKKPNGEACPPSHHINCGPIPGTHKHKCCASAGDALGFLEFLTSECWAIRDSRWFFSTARPN